MQCLSIRPNLELKTRPKSVSGSLPLVLRYWAREEIRQKPGERERETDRQREKETEKDIMVEKEPRTG